jgi:hypothetical protein
MKCFEKNEVVKITNHRQEREEELNHKSKYNLQWSCQSAGEMLGKHIIELRPRQTNCLRKLRENVDRGTFKGSCEKYAISNRIGYQMLLRIGECQKYQDA